MSCSQGIQLKMFSAIVRVQSNRLLFGRTTPALRFILTNRNFATDERPKKPLGSYILFCQEKRSQVISNNPDLSFADIAKHLGEEWKRLPDSQKQPFHIRAKELLEEYYREKDEFESNLSETELAKLQEADDKKKAAKVKRKMRAEMKKLERPKRPKNAYALFVSENFRKGGNSQAEVTRISELWNMTPEEDRVPFQEEAKKLKEEYDVELEAWKAKMIAEGRQDLFEPKDKKAKKSKSKRQVKRKSKAAKEEVDEEEEWEEEEEEEDDDGF